VGRELFSFKHEGEKKQEFFESHVPTRTGPFPIRSDPTKDGRAVVEEGRRVQFYRVSRLGKRRVRAAQKKGPYVKKNSFRNRLLGSLVEGGGFGSYSRENGLWQKGKSLAVVGCWAGRIDQPLVARGKAAHVLLLNRGWTRPPKGLAAQERYGLSLPTYRRKLRALLLQREVSFRE